MKEKDLLKKIKEESDRLVPDVYDKVVKAANAQGLLNGRADTSEASSDGKTVALGGFKRKAIVPVAIAVVVAAGLAIALPIALKGNFNEGDSPAIEVPPGPPSPPKPEDKDAVVYKGMSASANAQVNTAQTNAVLTSAKVSDEVSVQSEYSAYRNEDFYISVKFENPKNYAILGLTITYSGTTNLFPCSSFEDSGDSENVFVRVEAKKSVATDVTAVYTISNITYSDGKEIKSAVYAEGANTSITVAINEYGTDVEKTQAVTGTKLNCLDDGMLSEDGVLIIPQGITEIGRYAFAYDESIKEIIIPDTVETIDEGAFYDCLSVEKVTIGSGIVFIDKNVFHNCEKISYVNYTGTLTDWCKIDFAYTASEQAERMKTDTAEKAIRYSNPTFFAHDLHINGELVTEVIVPQEITALKYAVFARCTSITKVVLHENVKTIGYYAFVTCTGINELDLGGVQVIDVSSFDGCYGITRLTLPETLREIKSGAFRAAEKIIEVYNLSELNLDIGRATNGYVAKYAKHVYDEVPAESNFLTDEDGFVWYTNPDIGWAIFLVGYVGTKTEITVPLTYEDKSVILNECAFAGNTVLEKVTFEEGFDAIPNRLFAYCFTLKEVILPQTVKSIGDHAFWSSGLEKIVLPEHCTKITQYAFSECKNLDMTIQAKEISIEKYALGSNTNLKITFAGTVQQWSNYVNALNTSTETKGILYDTDFTAVCSDGTYKAYGI